MRITSKHKQEWHNQLQSAYQFILNKTFYDKVTGKVVCLTSKNEVIDYLAQSFSYVLLGAIPSIEPGLVLFDYNGEGASQK